jgi:hypothetical protein
MCTLLARISAALLALIVAAYPVTTRAQTSADETGLEPVPFSPASQSDEFPAKSPAEKPSDRRLAIGLTLGFNVSFAAMGGGTQLGATQPIPMSNGPRTGVLVGLVGTWKITNIFALRAGIQYAQKGTDAQIYQPAGYGSSPYGTSPYGYSPYGTSPYGTSPYGTSPYGTTPYGYSPYGTTPYGYSPYGTTPYGYSPYGTTPYGYSPYGTSPYGSTLGLTGYGTTTPASLRLDYLEFPLLAQLRFSEIPVLSTLSYPITLFANAGPVLGLAVNRSIAYGYNPTGYLPPPVPNYNSVDLTLDFGGGAEVSISNRFGVFVDLHYGLGLIDVDPTPYSSYYSRVFGASTGVVYKL